MSKSVLITGASSGIGRACALALARDGFRVFGAVRKQSDAEDLSQASNGAIQPLILDVLEPDSIRAAVEVLERELGTSGLDGLVNNAGIAVSAPLAVVPLAMFDDQMRVNVHGQLAVTQACLPLLRRARGRIVFMSSLSGLLTMPFMGPYSASKHAIEALANAFRLELAGAGIHVSLIEPGSIKSSIWNKIDRDAEQMEAQMSPEARTLYASDLKTLVAVPRVVAKNAIEPSAVAKAVKHALTSRLPRARYLVGLDARGMAALFALAPTRVSDWIVRQAVKRISNS